MINKAFFILISCLCLWFNKSFSQTVDPLIKAKFHQNAPFNLMCPENSAAGCGAIAISQILSYYKTLLHGYGSVSYTSGSLNVPVNVNFDEITFDWENILPEYVEGEYNSLQANAVAKLVYACGAAMYSDYGKSTGVNNYAKMLYGLQHYLHFSPESRYLKRAYYSTAEWTEMINRQLRDGHPVFYRGSWLFNGGNAGHMFIVDGINDEGLYHVNFGHGGNGNKYVDINVINQSGTYPGGRPVCYNATQAMVTNCYPVPDFEDYPKQVCISEEPIILNKDSLLNSIKINCGEKFYLSCRLRNCCDEKTTVKYGWCLVKDGKIEKILTESTYGLSAGYTFAEAKHQLVSLPKDIGDGNYQLRLYSKSDFVSEPNFVWDNAPSTVYVEIENGIATVSVPDNHLQNPLLYLGKPIEEVGTEFENFAPGRSFLLAIKNSTVNNFQNTIRLELVADGETYVYDVVLPVYSQTETEFHVMVPNDKINLDGKDITSVKASYYYALEDRFIEMGESIPSSVDETLKASSENGDIRIYTLQGYLIKIIPASEVADVYGRVLSNLPHGCYIIKEKQKARKIIL